MSNDEQSIRDLVASWHSATARGEPRAGSRVNG